MNVTSLRKLKIEELRNLARSHSIDTKGKMTKAEIVELLCKSLCNHQNNVKEAVTKTKLMKIGVEALRIMAKKHGVSADGLKKPELVDHLCKAICTTKTKTKTKSKNTVAIAANATTKSALTKMKVDELRQLAKKVALVSSGTKAELVQKLCKLLCKTGGSDEGINTNQNQLPIDVIEKIILKSIQKNENRDFHDATDSALKQDLKNFYHTIMSYNSKELLERFKMTYRDLLYTQLQQYAPLLPNATNIAFVFPHMIVRANFFTELKEIGADITIRYKDVVFRDLRLYVAREKEFKDDRYHITDLQNVLLSRLDDTKRYFRPSSYMIMMIKDDIRHYLLRFKVVGILYQLLYKGEIVDTNTVLQGLRFDDDFDAKFFNVLSENVRKEIKRYYHQNSDVRINKILDEAKKDEYKLDRISKLLRESVEELRECIDAIGLHNKTLYLTEVLPYHSYNSVTVLDEVRKAMLNTKPERNTYNILRPMYERLNEKEEYAQYYDSTYTSETFYSKEELKKFCKIIDFVILCVKEDKHKDKFPNKAAFIKNLEACKTRVFDDYDNLQKNITRVKDFYPVNMNPDF